MRVRLVRRDGDKATLLVTPSWIAKVFGARPYLVQCERLKCYSVKGLRDELFGGVEGFRWVIAPTHRGVSVVMLEALEREEIEPLPKMEVHGVAGGAVMSEVSKHDSRSFAITKARRLSK